MVYSPLATGLLSGVYSSDTEAPLGTLWGDQRRGHLARVLRGQAAELLRLVREVAARSGATVAQVALAWVLAHPEITTAITGADTDAQFDENLGALDLLLAPEDREKLDQASAGLGLRLDGPELAHGRAAGTAPTQSDGTA